MKINNSNCKQRNLMKICLFHFKIKPLLSKSNRLELYLFICLFLCTFSELKSELISPTQWKSISQNSDYIVGHGIGSDLEQARQSALSSLVNSISINVSSQFNYSASEEIKENGINAEEKINSIINSYSAATLNNVDEYVEKNKGEYSVYKFIKRADLRAMFKKRIALARKWIWEARRSINEGKTGDAIRDYYWALLLLRSCPDADLEVFEDENGEHNMIQLSFSEIKSILSSISVEATELEMQDGMQHVTLHFSSGESDLTNFNYRYIYGKNLSELYTAKDGYGEIVLPASVKLSKVKIQAEYECRDEANINPDLKSVINMTDPVSLALSQIKISTKNCHGIESNNYFLQVAKSSKKAIANQEGNKEIMESESYVSENTGDEDYINKCKETIESVQKAIITKSIEFAQPYFTSDGWDMFTRIMNYGTVRLLRQPEPTLLPVIDGMVCRSFPMSFSFKSNTRNFTEDLVLYMDKNAKVYELAFGLEKIALNDIMERGEWNIDARHQMVHFLETYKTAYALKRIDYINSIFSNEALIITGAVVFSTGKDEIGLSLRRRVKYTRQTKAEYMENLDKCFKSNEFVNIKFADNIIRRSHSNPNIYGIQIKQDYFSSSYGDTGYLFLMLDFVDPISPIIHVRTWQPDLDSTSRDGRIGMADFQL